MLFNINNYNDTKSWLINNKGVYSKNSVGEAFDTLCLLIKNHPNYNGWKFNTPYKFKIIMKKYIQLHVLFEGAKKYRIVSWTQCCKGKVTKKDPLTSAMRQAIKRQITIYKNSNIDKKCVLCGSTDNIEVDHYPIKFVDIKNDFLINNTHTSPQEFDWHPKRGYSMFKPCDKVFKTKWQKYHHSKATYRYLCSKCNKIHK